MNMLITGVNSKSLSCCLDEMRTGFEKMKMISMLILLCFYKCYLPPPPPQRRIRIQTINVFRTVIPTDQAVHDDRRCI